MAEPKIARRKPYRVDLAPGKYNWCSCGESNAQPYCDSTHLGTGCTPVEIIVTDMKKDVWLCACKRSSNKPYCDGTHRGLK